MQLKPLFLALSLALAPAAAPREALRMLSDLDVQPPLRGGAREG